MLDPAYKPLPSTFWTSAKVAQEGVYAGYYGTGTTNNPDNHCIVSLHLITNIK